jgi:hypothetical protein
MHDGAYAGGPGGRLSDDGRWWWDGAQWLPTSTPERWDGAQRVGEHCLRTGCESPAAFQCGYTDRTGVCCGTWWCASHSLEVNGAPYCSRHADVVALLAAGRGSIREQEPPLMADRTLSLVRFVHRDCNQAMIELLQAENGSDPEVQVVADSNVRTMFQGSRLAWEQGWSAHNNTGNLYRIVLRVPTGEPPVVQVLVGWTEVMAGTPDWIVNRAGAQSELRDAFRLRILAAVKKAIERPAFI